MDTAKISTYAKQHKHRHADVKDGYGNHQTINISAVYFDDSVGTLILEDLSISKRGVLGGKTFTLNLSGDQQVRFVRETLDALLEGTFDTGAYDRRT